jgi:hypothetical protein
LSSYCSCRKAASSHSATANKICHLSAAVWGQLHLFLLLQKRYFHLTKAIYVKSKFEKLQEMLQVFYLLYCMAFKRALPKKLMKQILSLILNLKSKINASQRGLGLLSSN